MSIKKLAEVQDLNAPNSTSDNIKKEYVDTVREFLDRKGYRADLVIASKVKNFDSTLGVEIKYNAKFDFPPDRDLMALVAAVVPQYEIDWSTAVVDPDQGTIALTLRTSVESIPVKSVRDIPSEFEAIGSGIFMKKADASGRVAEIWELKKDESGGLVLSRKMDDMEVLQKEEEGFVAGDVVATSDGVGRIDKFDPSGNAYVVIGNKTRLVAADDLKPYDIKTEQTKLYEYYKAIYGDEYAKMLLDTYSDVKDTRK